jgi:hypothetical protein
MTQDERKQQLIVRQSQMERVIEYYTLRGITPTTLELFTTVDLFSDFIMNSMTPEVKERSKNMDKHLQTKSVVKSIVE